MEEETQKVGERNENSQGIMQHLSDVSIVKIESQMK